MDAVSAAAGSNLWGGATTITDVKLEKAKTRFTAGYIKKQLHKNYDNNIEVGYCEFHWQYPTFDLKAGRIRATAHQLSQLLYGDGGISWWESPQR
jgi:hypothetical protein